MSSPKAKELGEKTMNKFKRIGIIILGFFITGFIMSFLIHSGLWNKLMNGFSSIHFLLYPVFIIVFFFLVILVHELGHLFSFVVNGIKIRALLVLGLVFKKTKKGFKFEIFTPLIKLLGGLVVPELPNLHNDEEYNNVVEKFSKALIAGPRTSLFYCLSIFIIFVLTLTLSNNNFFIGFFALNFIVTLLLTILVMLSSKVHTDTLYGDFVAYKKMNEDKLFQLNQITQYTSFKLYEDITTNEYLINKIASYIKNNSIAYNLFTINLYAQYINLIIYNDYNNFDEEVAIKIASYRINRLINNKHGLELAYLISAYFYKNRNVEKSYNIYNTIKIANKKLYDKLELDQLNLKYSHLLNIENNTNELLKEENLFSEDVFLLKPILDEEDLKKEAVYQLEFVEYFTEIYCDIKKSA